MRFADEVIIEVSSGKGGDGAVAFRREKFVPKGGPAGGDGGRGGDVILEATDDLTTLYELSFTRHFKAEDGKKGQSKNMMGANGRSLYLKVPVGTLVYNQDSGRLLVDLAENGQQEVIARGGRGGRGNARFVSSVRRAPRMAEKGEPGQTLRLRLELKLLADVGLVGLPNAGKSTFLRSVSNARPKVADYPFTTLIPCLGIVKPKDAPSFCMADIPGLIEGAHQGNGLGIQFLKHIERTRLLLHLVDTAQLDRKQILKNYDVIMAELKAFSEDLAAKPIIVAANKIDLPESRELFPLFKEALAERGISVFAVSGATREGVDDLLQHLSSMLKTIQTSHKIQANEEEAVYKYLPAFEIKKSTDGYYIVTGTEIERLAAMTDFTSHEAIAIFKRKLKKIGFINELAILDAKDKDVISIGDMEFEYQEFFD